MCACRERSLLQFKSLEDQFLDVEPPASVRYPFAYCTQFPLRWQLRKEVAYVNMGIGMLVSAFEAFKELDMYEDAANCLAHSGRETKAENYIRETIVQHGETPELLCILGNLLRDPTQYKKAW